MLVVFCSVTECTRWSFSVIVLGFIIFVGLCICIYCSITSTEEIHHYELKEGLYYCSLQSQYTSYLYLSQQLASSLKNSERIQMRRTS
jgi:hypothetical protein